MHDEQYGGEPGQDPQEAPTPDPQGTTEAPLPGPPPGVSDEQFARVQERREGSDVAKDPADEEPAPGVLSENEVKTRFITKLNNGDLVLDPTLVRGLVYALGVEDEIDHRAAFGIVPAEESPTAGLTPATGSGGAPYKPEAATDETIDAGRKFKEELDAEDRELTPVERVQKRAVASSVEGATKSDESDNE